MAKPWARLELNYINHRKFLALNANAICLWHEGKNFCDMHLTDGLIPKEALLTFRFNSRKAVVLLTTSAGAQPNGQPFEPLWETHPLGFKMHSYLDHNDCREVVQKRIAKAEAEKELDRQRKAAARDRKAELSGRNSGDCPVGIPERVQ